MKTFRILLLIAILSMLLVPVAPAQSQPPPPPGTLAGETGSVLSPDAYPILACAVTGITGDLADSRGIRFTVSQNFTAVEVRLATNTIGSYTLQAELRQSTGFTAPILATASATAALPASGSLPYKPVTFTFSPVTVAGSQTFTLKFNKTSGTGAVFFETAGIGNQPCPNVEETEENNVAIPTVRGDPTGFKVLAANPADQTVNSPWTGTPPVLDGVISSGEWDLTAKIPFENGFFAVRNDGFRLYLLLDMLYDTVDNPAGGNTNDYFWVAFDKNKDAAITPNVDLMYGTVSGTDNMRLSYFLGANTWTGTQPVTRSARGRGFGCYFTDGSLSITSFRPLQINCLKHVVWELGIDLNEIGGAPGSALKMGVRVSSPVPAFTNEIPPGFGGDFSHLITVNLAPSPQVFPARTPGAVLSLDTRPIEVTQAIQNRDNTLPLVANKDTVARVYVNLAGAASTQPSLVWLYGSQAGSDLPGSPLLRYLSVPTVVNRATTNHTANFALPATWIGSGAVDFSARVRDWAGNENARSIAALNFTGRKTPTYWIVPVNTNTAGSPVLVSDAEITSQQSYLRAVYPVQNVTFVRKDWTVIGPTTVNNTIDALNQYYSNVTLAWLISLIFTGHAPFTMPDQIYGFTPSGGGISDPTWYGSQGWVARGYRGSSREGTMAHEIDHNLDRSLTGTWGRHVGDPATTIDSGGNVVPVYNANWGCGAAGPDASWPFNNDDSIREVGFDTRAASFGAVPGDYPDFMSYCQSSGLPTKWISPYRWNNEYNSFALPANDAMLQKVASAPPSDVFYVSGHVDKDGTGGLNAILKQVGYASTFPTSGNVILQERGAKGELLGSYYMQAIFPQDEEEPVNTFHFNVQLPVLRGATQVVLIYNDKIISQITASKNAPTVTLTAPNGGEKWTSGMQTVTWDASDVDNDPLTFSLLYTPDNGAGWYPIAAGLTGKSFDIDAASLPSGTGARFRVIVSDGFFTAQDDSDGVFTVEANPLQVSITSPDQNATLSFDLGVTLTGEANSPDDPAIPAGNFIWSEGAANLGTGPSIHVQLLPGPHTVTLTVADSFGNEKSATRSFFAGFRVLLPVIRR